MTDSGPFSQKNEGALEDSLTVKLTRLPNTLSLVEINLQQLAPTQGY